MGRRRIMMLGRLYPTRAFASVTDIGAEALHEMGIELLLADVDGTLTGHGLDAVSNDVALWVGLVKDAGVRVIIVSNSGGDRVRAISDSLGIDYVEKAGKPLRRGFIAAMAASGAEAGRTAVVGDQLFTDVWGGSRAGTATFLVDPIPGAETAFIRFKRLLERPILRRVRKRMADGRPPGAL